MNSMLILKCIRPPKGHSGSDLLKYQFAWNNHNILIKQTKSFSSWKFKNMVFDLIFNSFIVDVIVIKIYNEKFKMTSKIILTTAQLSVGKNKCYLKSFLNQGA